MHLNNLKFNRHELAGSFGDIGTVLPLLIGMLSATNLDSASVFIMFGLVQIAMGLFYRIPVPIQPLKAMAVMIITLKLSGNIIFGAGFAIGITMLILTLTRSIDWIAKIIPHCVIRGIQFGLGLALASLALKNYIPAEGLIGYLLATIGFIIMLIFANHRTIPRGLLLIGLGLFYSLVFKIEWSHLFSGISVALPKLNKPNMVDIWTGFIILALPQLPLSISNSIIATEKVVKDYFPERKEKVTVRQLGITYSIANLIIPFFSGIPVCHGCGGVVGCHTFGARTGGAIVFNGLMYATVGLFFSKVIANCLTVFPQAILGVVLIFEAINLMMLSRDLKKRNDFFITLVVALVSFSCPQGYLVGALLGTGIYYLNADKLFHREDKAEAPAQDQRDAP